MKRLILLTGFAFLAMFISLPAMAQGIDVPASWGGIWDTDWDEQPCSGGSSQSSSSTDTLCSGYLTWEELFELADLGVEVDVNCEGEFTETTAIGSCTWAITAEGFTITSTTSFNMTRSGDAYGGTEMFEIEYGGSICDLSPETCAALNQCTTSQVTAERTGPEPPSCVTPVEQVTWGQIKALYE